MSETESATNEVEPELDRNFLREVGLFGGLSDELLDYLAAHLDVKIFEPGQIVFREGEPGRVLFVVMRGEFEVFKKSKTGVEARVALFGEKDWFGEMSVLDVQPRSATVRALAHSFLLTITPEDLDRLYRKDVRGYALFILNIARELSRRLRVADGILANLVTEVLGGMVAARHGAAT